MANAKPDRSGAIFAAQQETCPSPLLHVKAAQAVSHGSFAQNSKHSAHNIAVLLSACTASRFRPDTNKPCRSAAVLQILFAPCPKGGCDSHPAAQRIACIIPDTNQPTHTQHASTNEASQQSPYDLAQTRTLCLSSLSLPVQFCLYSPHNSGNHMPCQRNAEATPLRCSTRSAHFLRRDTHKDYFAQQIDSSVTLG